jgi:hypothetical protein
MKNEQKKTAQSSTSERSVFRTCVENDCKIIIPRSTKNASPNLPGREVPSLSGVELVFVTIGISWLVGQGFRGLEAIDR